MSSFDNLFDNLYYLNEKYYQKLGEVWDHETKDFKVLYKPLYCCNSKVGSFEAHHLATSTFERWEGKFTRVTSLDEIEHIQELKDYIVSNGSIRELSRGNPKLPTVSTPIPCKLQVASAKAIVHVEDVPSSATTPIGQSDSGYGSRSLIPYFAIHFDAKWKELILNGKKTATTRVLSKSKDKKDDLALLINQVKNTHEGVMVKCLCGGGKKTPCEIFGNVCVTRVDEHKVKNLSIELAKIEQFNTVSEFIECLQGYYPDLTLDDDVYTFYFKLE